MHRMSFAVSMIKNNKGTAPMKTLPMTLAIAGAALCAFDDIPQIRYTSATPHLRVRLLIPCLWDGSDVNYALV